MRDRSEFNSRRGREMRSELALTTLVKTRVVLPKRFILLAFGLVTEGQNGD